MTRNRPPRALADFGDTESLGARYAAQHGVDAYVKQYRNGWSAADRSSDSRAFNSGLTSHAWDDGYLDRAAGRERWHMTYCPEHDNTPTGCQEA